MSDLVVGRWGARFMGRHLPCAIGRAGFSGNKREGDGATPVGRFRLVAVWWRADRLARPKLGGRARPLNLRPIGPRLGWCDAPDDAAYNRAVRLPHRASAERMRRADRLYDIVAVTDHNAAGVPGAGSAIFLHVRRGLGRCTAGCVAFRRDHLLWILARWRGGRIVLGPDGHGRPGWTG